LALAPTSVFKKRPKKRQRVSCSSSRL
jgi:hypothetical protein